MAASTVPAAKAKVLQLLQARAALNQVQITWGEPTESEDLADEVMFFDPEVVRVTEHRVLGTGQLDELYTITLVVRNRMFGDDPAATEQRCWVLINEIEQELRADPTLGGILSASQDDPPIAYSEQTVRSATLSDGWMAEGVFPLTCHARI